MGYNIVMVEIVAEIGINHNGNLDTAKDMIRAAKDCGADTCKFQAFSSYYSHDGNSELHKTLVATGLIPDRLEQLKRYCEKRNIGFLCSAFDRVSIDWLVALGEKRIKIPSSRNTIPEYLGYVRSKKFEEVIIAVGACTQNNVVDLWNSFGGKRTIVECVSAYPCDPSKFVVRGPHWYQIDGISDHSLSWEAGVICAVKQFRYYEKHFTLDKNAKGPDHQASLNPKEFSQMVEEIRNVEQILRNAEKVILPEEQSIVIRKRNHNVDQYKD